MRLLHVALAALLTVCAAAHADTLTTYNVTGTFHNDNSSTFSGTLTFDSTTDSISSIDLALNNGSTFSFTSIDNQNSINSGLQEAYRFQSTSTDGSDPTLSMYFWLVGTNALEIASFDTPLRINQTNFYSKVALSGEGLHYFQNGSLSLPGTPEPSTLALVGTALGGLWTARRRVLA